MTTRAYVRISLDTAVSGSIKKQREQLRRYAGEEVVWYEDRSVSGSKVPLREREAGSRLLADLRPGDRVIVTKIDRLARSVQDLLSTVDHIEQAGASITFTEQAISTEGPTGKLSLAIFGAVAQFEAALISERRKESLASFKGEGRHAVGSAPYGLHSVPNPNGRGLVLRPDPEQAPLLRDVVSRVLTGETQRSLAAELGLSETYFGRLIRNSRLAGVLDPSDETPRIDPDMAVFSLAEWEELQTYLDRPLKAWTRAEGYGELLRCSECGERLYFNASKRKPEFGVYRCRRHKHGADQPGASITVGLADQIVTEDFLREYGDLPVMVQIRESASAERAEAIAKARFNMDAAQRAQNEAESDTDMDSAFRAYKLAKQALKDAEAMPETMVTKWVGTGETYGERWERDPSDRVAIAKTLGCWIVSPGRMPAREKVRWAPETTPKKLGELWSKTQKPS